MVLEWRIEELEEQVEFLLDIVYMLVGREEELELPDSDLPQRLKSKLVKLGATTWRAKEIV